MRVKPGVNLNGVHFMCFYAAVVYSWLRETNGYGEGTITGGKEGADKVGPARVRNTLHPLGRAVDLRTNDLPADVPPQLAAALGQALGTAFHVVLEPDHIHVEFNEPTIVRM